MANRYNIALLAGTRRRISQSYADGLLQERRNSIALAMELRLSCTNPLIQQEPRRKIIELQTGIPELDPRQLLFNWF